MDVNKLLEGLGYKPIPRQNKHIETWEQFYIGFVPDFHEYKDYQGAEIGTVTRKRKSLKMAKSISELWADNIINPETEFVFDEESNQAWWDEFNQEHGVTAKLNDLMELTFALGTGATVQNKDKNGKVFNQYVSMQHIYPLKSHLGEIVSCGFVSEENDEIYIQVHEKQDSGKYLIKNLYFDKEGQPLKREDVLDEFESDVKLFQLFTPAIVNNLNMGNPLGISIFANALDELKAVDIAYDALDKEVRNGRMRVYIRGEALIMDKGTKKPIFNKEQDEFYLLPEDDNDKELIKIQAPTLRIDQLIDNLEKQLNLLGSKCGLGDNAFYSEGGTIYTNTAQVISTNSKFYKTRTKHTTRIENALVQMVQALYFLDTGSELVGVHVDFDDSIIHDKDEEYNRARLEYANGLISAVEYFSITRNMTLEEAKTFYKLQLELQGLTPDVPEEGGEV